MSFMMFIVMYSKKDIQEINWNIFFFLWEYLNQLIKRVKIAKSSKKKKMGKNNFFTKKKLKY
jgi:hypothetical protein